MADLRAITVYLPAAEIAALEREAIEGGRGGVSSHIRYVLARRRHDLDNPGGHFGYSRDPS